MERERQTKGDTDKERETTDKEGHTCISVCLYLADGGQFGEQHLEHRGGQGLLQHLEQLLGLPTHRDGVGQVVHPRLVVT